VPHTKKRKKNLPLLTLAISDLNVRFALTVIKDVPHGFLSFKDNCKETMKAYLKVLRLLQGALNGEVPLSEVPEQDWQSFF
jgi:hypothetical protein